MNEEREPEETSAEADAETETPPEDGHPQRDKAEADREAARLMAKLEMDVFGHP